MYLCVAFGSSAAEANADSIGVNKQMAFHDLGRAKRIWYLSPMRAAKVQASLRTARMRSLAWTFAARIGDKYQIRLTRSISQVMQIWEYIGTGARKLYIPP